MIKKPASVENHIYEGKMREYEKILMQFVMESGRAKSVDHNLQLILGYIGIHKTLTQKQLRDLTGLSPGTISNKLKTLLNFGIVKKDRIPKSNESLYINAPESYEDTAEATFDDFTKINEFLKGKLLELEKLKNRKGAHFLSERIKKLTMTFETVQNIWSDIEFIFKQKRDGVKQ
ncbi:MAG: MarR family transcriptional regulator [Promethearchaeota archaeon]|jgi:DNA-binding transcriptional regulator GbsR (MarR family)